MGNQSSIPLDQVFQTTDSQIQSAINTAVVGNANKSKNIAGGVTFNIPYQRSPDTTDFISNVGVNDGSVLTYSNVSGPQWKPAIIGNAEKTTNIAGGLQFNIPYQTAADKTGWIPNGNTNDILQLGSTRPTWISPSVLAVGSSRNLTAGAEGSIPFQTASNVTGFLPRPTAAGNFVLSNTSTSTSPVWTLSSGLDVRSASNLSGGAPGTLPYQTMGNTTAQLARPTATGTFALTITNSTVPTWTPSSGMQAGSASNDSFSIGNWKIFTEGTALCNMFQNFKTCTVPDRLSLTTAFTTILATGKTFTILQSPSRRYELRFLNGYLSQYDNVDKTTRMVTPTTVAIGQGPWTLAVNTSTRQITLTSNGMTGAYWSSPSFTSAAFVVLSDSIRTGWTTPLEIIQTSTNAVLTTI